MNNQLIHQSRTFPCNSSILLIVLCLGFTISPLASAAAPGDKELWASIKQSEDPTVFDDYIARFPEGIYVDVATIRAQRLRSPGFKPTLSAKPVSPPIAQVPTQPVPSVITPPAPTVQTAATSRNTPTVSSTEPPMIRIHYFRPDNNYQAWGIHAWEPEVQDLTGKWAKQSYFQKQDDYGAVFEIDAARVNSKRVGFIVRNGEVKDCNLDREWNLGKSLEIWTVSNTCEVFFDKAQALSLIKRQ